MRAQEDRKKAKERKMRAKKCHKEWVTKKEQELKAEREARETKRKEERLQTSEVWNLLCYILDEWTNDSGIFCLECCMLTLVAFWEEIAKFGATGVKRFII